MMHNQLCEFANRFPLLVADILERDRHKRRNFREESITDLMMAGLIGLEAYGIRVDFPDEVSTGADMDWEFVSLHPVNGNRYLRLYIQAKRAIVTKSKKSPKWFYRELDYESPKGSGKGSQAQTLVKAAAAAVACCPLYFFYHPRQALKSASAKLAAIDGVNAVIAHSVAKAVAGGCGISEKEVSHWRPQFMTLADILCWPAGVLLAPQARLPGAQMQFMSAFQFTAAFSPDRLAERLEAARQLGTRADTVPSEADTDNVIRPSDRVPEATMRAIQGEMSTNDRASLKRPRAIFVFRDPTRARADE